MQNGKELWISQNYFSMENPVVGSMVNGPGGVAQVHRGPRQRGQECATVPCRRVGARAHRCSPAAVKEDEPNEAVLEGCAPERRRGGTTEAKNDGGLSLA
jgi:hypothetical protein